MTQPGDEQGGAPEEAQETAAPPAEPAEPTGPGEPTGPAEQADPGATLADDGGDMANETEAGEEPSGEVTDESVDDELTVTQMALAERTADLQRLQAEFLNYKRRVDRDRDLIKENATYAALTPIVDVLDTIDRAREHGELEPGFRAVADQLERVVGALGLIKFGAPGDAFDPSLHEALSHIGEDPDVEVTTCKVIARSGYRIGERVVRAAQVLVVDPAGA